MPEPNKPSSGCPICASFSDPTSWGEEMASGGGFIDTPEPPSFKRLTRLNPKQYRCPECNTYYVLDEGGGSFLNAEWTNWTLTRASVDALWVVIQEFIRLRDFTELARALLGSSGAARAEIFETLEAQVAEGLDIAPLAPTLRGMSDGAEGGALAVKVLTRYWLRQAGVAQVEELLRSERPEVRLAAFGAIATELCVSPELRPSLGACLGVVRPFLGSDDEKLRSLAGTLVGIVGLQPENADATIADATRRLNSPAPGERAAAASILARAAEQKADIRAALPRLQQLAKESGDRSIKFHVERAIKATGGWLKYIGGAAGLGEHLLHKGGVEDVLTLRAMQERGEDVASAFEALAAWKGGEWLWAAEVLKHAAIQGDDLTPAVPGLQARIEKADQEPSDLSLECHARLCVGILACHFFHRRNFIDLVALLKADQVRHRGGASEIVGELTGWVWGKQSAKDETRRRAAAALACLSVWADRSDLVSLAFDLELPDDVIAGVLGGLLAAAKSGMDVGRFVGRIRRLKRQPLVAEIVAAVKPEPLRPVDRTDWHSGRDGCQVTDTEVVCWSGTGRDDSGASCTLSEFLEGKLQETVRSIFGDAVFREVLNAVKSKIPAREKPPQSRKGARARKGRPRRS